MLTDGEKERIDEIGFGGMKLIQSPAEFCYGIDAVLLADFAAKAIGQTKKQTGSGSTHEKRPEKVPGKEIEKELGKVPEEGLEKESGKEEKGLSGKKREGICCDLGTGNGIIPLILAHKTDLLKIYGVEVQEEPACRANRSVRMNELEDRIVIVRMDVLGLAKTAEERRAEKRNGEFPAEEAGNGEKESGNGKPEPGRKEAPEAIHANRAKAEKEKNDSRIRELFSVKGCFDLVLSNPPYFEREDGMDNKLDALKIARSETTAGLPDFMRAASGLLKKRASFCMIHRPARLADIFVAARETDLEPKEIQFVRPRKGEEPNLVLLRFVKAGGKELHYLPDLIVYEEDGTYSDEVLRAYERI